MENDIKIQIALISASSAIAGALISQLVSICRDYFDKNHKRDILLRERYEELAYLISADSLVWFNEQMGAMSLKELNPNPPIQARKAMVLAHIYFSPLKEGCQKYVNVCAQFQTMLASNHGFVERKDAGTQAAYRNREALDKIANNLHLCRNELEELIILYAKKYTKA